MKVISRLLLAVILTLTVGITIARAEKEEDIPLDKVPEKVLKAAQKAVPGIKLTEAEVEKTSKGLVYELEGTSDGIEYEIEVSADGKIAKIEKDDDDDENENDGDNEDEDEDDGDDKD